jgi:transcriptional regulator
MYTPDHFAMDDFDTIRDFIIAHNFAALIGRDADDQMIASHLPFMFDATRGDKGTLIAHMARANPHWQGFAADADALVIFQGPHAYISPSWYVNDPAVPTWNYLAVHAYGRPLIIDDETEKRAMFERLVATHEAGFETPWQLEGPEDFLAKMSRGTVAFEIEVSRFDAKAKLGQNRKAGDPQGVIQNLRRQNDQTAGSLADITEQWIKS